LFRNNPLYEKCQGKTILTDSEIDRVSDTAGKFSSSHSLLQRQNFLRPLLISVGQCYRPCLSVSERINQTRSRLKSKIHFFKIFLSLYM